LAAELFDLAFKELDHAGARLDEQRSFGAEI
jgi:hypothetical protein